MFNLQNYEYFEDVNFALKNITPRGKLILDVGCGNGLMGFIYRQKNNVVYGIDRSPAVKEIVQKRLNKFYSEDLTNFTRISQLLGRKKFDIIVFADVLEHLYDPVGVLNFYKKFLKPGGLFYISVPNIAIWYARLLIFTGNFTYTSTGTFDKTHLRFFTKKNLLLFAHHAGLETMSFDITPGIFRYFLLFVRELYKKKGEKFKRRALIQSRLYRFYARFIYPFEYLFCKLRPELFAFQFVGVFKRRT